MNNLCIINRTSPWCIYCVDACGKRHNVTPKVSSKVLPDSCSAFDTERHAKVALAFYLSGLELATYNGDLEEMDDAFMMALDILSESSYTLAGCRYFVQQCPVDLLPNELNKGIIRVYGDPDEI